MDVSQFIVTRYTFYKVYFNLQGAKLKCAYRVHDFKYLDKCFRMSAILTGRTLQD